MVFGGCDEKSVFVLYELKKNKTKKQKNIKIKKWKKLKVHVF